MESSKISLYSSLFRYKTKNQVIFSLCRRSFTTAMPATPSSLNKSPQSRLPWSSLKQGTRPLLRPWHPRGDHCSLTRGLLLPNHQNHQRMRRQKRQSQRLFWSTGLIHCCFIGLETFDLTMYFVLWCVHSTYLQYINVACTLIKNG